MKSKQSNNNIITDKKYQNQQIENKRQNVFYVV